MKIDEKEKCTEEIIMKKTDKNDQNMPQIMDQIIIPKKVSEIQWENKIGINIYTLLYIK